MLTKDPLFDVTWALAGEKSKFSMAKWSPSTETRVYEEVPGGYKLTVSGINNGTPYTWGYTALYDGQDHSVIGRADVDTIEAYRINDRITVGFFKKNNVFGGRYSRHVSDDGQTLTVVASGIDDSGSPYFDVIEYEKP